MIKGGLAWLLWQEGRVVNTVVGRGTSSGVGLVVYRREEGEETMNTEQIEHQKYNKAIRGARGDLTQG